MATHTSRFLRRIWYGTHSTDAPGFKDHEGKWRKLDRAEQKLYAPDHWTVGKSNMQIGICVGIDGDYYNIVREWSSYDSRISMVLQVPERNIIASIPVDMNELLTHGSDIVRRFARDRVKIKGLD